MTVENGLSGKRVLVVEDEYLIAADLKRELHDRDATVLGPVGDLAAGLALLERETPDAAVIDVNLDGAMSYPLADRLEAARVPYLFLTGYDDWALPEAYRAAQRLVKPQPMGKIAACLERLVEDAAR